MTSVLQQLNQYTVNYFEILSQEAKDYWVEQTTNLLYDIEDEEIIDERIYDSDDDKFMERVQQYVFYKENCKKINGLINEFFEAF